MSWFGLKVARTHGATLPTFSAQPDAERVLFSLRDESLRELSRVTELKAQLTFSPESLDLVERWYFEHGEPESFPSGKKVAHALGFYLGEVFCREAAFTWVVQEFAFTPAKFEIGVQRELSTIMVTQGRKPVRERNARMQSLSREFRRYAT